MRGGYARMVGEPVRISDVDLDATREHRDNVHAAVRRRAHLVTVLVDCSGLAAGGESFDGEAADDGAARTSAPSP